MSKEKKFISAVIYVHNAEDRIEKFLNTIIDVLEKHFEHSEVICINDCSDDESVAIIKKISARALSTSVSIVNLSFFHGLELAMNAGVDMSIGDFVFEFDNTNLDFDPEIIIKIYHLSLTGYDIVSASPDKKEKFSSEIFYKLFDKFSEFPYNMNTESFRIISRRAINRVNSMNNTIPYRKAIYASSGLKSTNLKYSVSCIGCKQIDSKDNKYRVSLAIDTLILFTIFGYKFSFLATSLMMLISIFMLIYTLVVYHIGRPIEGWTTTVLFLSVSFFGLFGILTIIVKYLQIIVNMVFKKKYYNFESIEKLTK